MLNKPVKFLPLILTTSLIQISFVSLVKADMAKVRCDFYPLGEDKATESTTCDFSQRQGFIGITKPDGTRYDFKPFGDRPNSYIDQNGKLVSQEINGNIGQIFRTTSESIFIYWDKQNSTTEANNSQPQTIIKDTSLTNITINITEGEFAFQGKLARSGGREFMGSDGKVRVLLNPYEGHIIIFSEANGEELYNYYIPPVSGVGEDPDTMCNPAEESC